MAAKEKLKADLKVLSENLKSLRKQALIKIKGIEGYLGVDGGHYRKYEYSDNEITPNVNTLSRLSKFYGVTLDDLIKKRNLALGSDLTDLESFKKKYSAFPEYFMDSLSVPDFIRLKVFPLSEMESGLKVSEIIDLFPDEAINSKSLSRELSRMVNKGKLGRKDSSGKGSVYIYNLKESVDR
ncbi:Helix-turn-helix [Algoriphagus locisalis]|uniref:Helix-turn-helix n=1 Tax=Algoriphagus locisalis TaxID=305507 RepID=A0A1I6XW02_9BACT|nr:helix-turn-helix transcriptional regulator [Algoriphagus locisalis]SFT42152.1 Helix-turn-helix [Algoriphagus locisalis]